MTNFNSGFNPNFNINPNIQKINVNPAQNSQYNPLLGNIKQRYIGQNIIDSSQNSLKNAENKNFQSLQEANDVAPKTPVYNYSMAKMDSEVLLKYLQNLMKMPENVNKLLDTLNSPIIKALVEKNIDTKILSQILNVNSTEATEKVLKVISESLKNGSKDISQLKDVLSILSTIQNSTSNNAVKELLLLYIPVNPPIFDKNVEFNSASAEEDEALNNSDFTLIFETVNFSNISCCINSYDNTLYIQLFADKSFPFDKFKKVIDTFKKEMNIRVEAENNIVKREENDKERIRNFNIMAGGFVSFDVLVLAHLIVKTIFKLDETFCIE